KRGARPKLQATYCGRRAHPGPADTYGRPWRAGLQALRHRFDEAAETGMHPAKRLPCRPRHGPIGMVSRTQLARTPESFEEASRVRIGRARVRIPPSALLPVGRPPFLWAHERFHASYRAN